jgi:hypothetical protein
VDGDWRDGPIRAYRARVLFLGRRATIGLLALALAGLAVLAAGCGGNTQPRSLSSGSASPSRPATATSSQSSSPTASPTPTATGSAAIKKQLKKSAKEYVSALNKATQTMNAEPLKRLVTSKCTCHGQIDAIQKTKQKGLHYVGKTRIVSVAPSLDDPTHGNTLVTLASTAGGTANENGDIVRRTPATQQDVDLSWVRESGRWLLDKIVYLQKKS